MYENTDEPFLFRHLLGNEETFRAAATRIISLSRVFACSCLQLTSWSVVKNFTLMKFVGVSVALPYVPDLRQFSHARCTVYGVFW